MYLAKFDPNYTEFILLSFEGPDPYAQAGGLGVRVANLAYALAGHGYRTHVFFIGDPDKPGYEEQIDGRLILHRWCQWISAYYPWGVYDGEEDKLRDYTISVPAFIVDEIAGPAAARGKRLVVLAEDWHMAGSVIELSDRLYRAGLRKYAVLLWNANNTMGFERIDWNRLGFVSTLTTVSRYMKQLMRTMNLDPLVIPNGIPSNLFDPLPKSVVTAIRQGLDCDENLLMFKVGRFDPAKNWGVAVEATARLKQEGERVAFLIRGGIEPYGLEVLQKARDLGLVVKDVDGKPDNWQEALDLIRSNRPADIFNLRFFMPQLILRPFYASADIILANSLHEPFGLVGLEAMAVGGIVFTGSTGEMYSFDGVSALSLDTDQAEEIVMHVRNMKAQPKRAETLRQAARQMALRFTWDNVLSVLFEKIILAAYQQKTEPFRFLEAPPIPKAVPLDSKRPAERYKSTMFREPPKTPHSMQPAGHRKKTSKMEFLIR